MNTFSFPVERSFPVALPFIFSKAYTTTVCLLVHDVGSKKHPAAMFEIHIHSSDPAALEIFFCISYLNVTAMSPLELLFFGLSNVCFNWRHVLSSHVAVANDGTRFRLDGKAYVIGSDESRRLSTLAGRSMRSKVEKG